MRKIRKKIISALVLMMVMASFTSCGKARKENDPKKETTDVKDAGQGENAEAAEVDETKYAENTQESSGEGKVLNVFSWNDEFHQRVSKFYPGYKDNGDGTGKIGDVTVNWLTAPAKDNAYQNELDKQLLAQESLEQDEKIDIFLLEADYLKKYIDTNYAMDVHELGITDEELSEQYPYTKEVATDSKGVLRALTWQVNPGFFVYRRSIAKKVFGTDEPKKIQKKLSNWEKFDQAAEIMGKNGYAMLAGFSDSYHAFSSNMTAPWVVSGEIRLDDSLMKWVDQTKAYTDKGYNHKADLFTDAWSEQQSIKGNTFGFFSSTWAINYVLIKNSLEIPEENGGRLEIGNGTFGDWACCCGPESFFWGGTWICAAQGTDNQTLAADIMRKFTTDADVMKSITSDPSVLEYTNNKKAMEELADTQFESAFFGGQNHIALFTKAAENIDMSNCTPYDQGLNEAMQTAFAAYFNGEISKEAAVENFYDMAGLRYPELEHGEKEED